MDRSTSIFLDIFQIYSRFCDIRSSDDANAREMLVELLKSVEFRWQARNSVFDDLSKLMFHLDLTVDYCRFTCFYDFVFFLCRENGQKNITIEMALAAWRFVLKGRFRLLNEWCNFVEKHQRYNISEDTWQQVLAFSRCVHEDLEGYDPKGAWPVIIDDFVEYMHRIRTSSFNCCDAEVQTCMANAGFHGRKSFSGLKRKPATSYYEREIEPLNSLNSNSWSFDLFSLKRNRKDELDNKQENWETRPAGDATDDCMDVVKQNGALASACTVEGSLSEGFAGLLSSSPCLHLNQKRVPYT
ncbi:hypothetical protein Syun_023581 [Stephania yunnanensis]|uniref:Defective in cullin neddylation protein n=1 Tax=Stephania yunnanensis TaxID=152371 RepID=A0AAP0FCD0_9MAGN